MRLIWLTVLSLLVGGVAWGETIRIATFNVALARKGPGILLADIKGGKDKQITAVSRIIKTVRPDILLLNEVDHDFENLALKAFLEVLASDDQKLKGVTYPYFYAPPQNTGVPSGLDLNGNGRLGDAADAFGYGRFRGQYAMALVSRFPIDLDHAQDFSKLLWKDIPEVNLPIYNDGRAFPSAEAHQVMRLSSKGHWDVPVDLPDGRVLHLLASHPTPPVFDGPEDFNGKRNAAEIKFWDDYVTENKAMHFIVLGDLNADPMAGDSLNAIGSLLANPLLHDPLPRSNGGPAAQSDKPGDPALDTADWSEEKGPGNLRVDYVLPSRSLRVTDAGVFWPAPHEAGFDLIGSDGRTSSDHRLVWVDVE